MKKLCLVAALTVSGCELMAQDFQIVNGTHVPVRIKWKSYGISEHRPRIGRLTLAPQRAYAACVPGYDDHWWHVISAKAAGCNRVKSKPIECHHSGIMIAARKKRLAIEVTNIEGLSL